MGRVYGVQGRAWAKPDGGHVEVAGVQPAVAVQTLCGGVGLVPVTQHHGLCTNLDLAGALAVNLITLFID